MSADPNLLNPAPFVVWDYWYSNYGGTAVCTLFGSPTDPYGAIPAWKASVARGQRGLGPKLL